MIKTIFVPASGSSTDASVFATALVLARSLEAHLHLHHVHLSADRQRITPFQRRRNVMRMRIVVADQSEARFYDTGSLTGRLQLSGTLTDPQAHLHERDLVSDRPGRVFDHAAPPSGRRGAVAHHSTGGERSARAHAAASFARQVAQALEVATREHHIDRIVLMAAPAFLGLLRAALPRAVKKAVVAEVHKDLVHQSDQVVKGHLPREAFGDLVASG
jgi:protein required for attachment to host cells